MPEFTEEVQPKKRGRRAGSVSEKTKLLREESIPIIKRMVELAKEGDTKAAKLILDISVPKLRPISPPISIRIPKNLSLTEQASFILKACLSGKIPVDECKLLIDSIASLVNLTQLDVVLAELDALKREIARMRWNG